MQANRQVRVIKGGRRAGEIEAGATRTAAASHVSAERDVRAVVNGWVREHREGVQDYRRALTALFTRLDAAA